MMMAKSAKPERLAIVDLTGQNLGPAVAKSMVEDQSRAGARALRAAATDRRPVPRPRRRSARLRPRAASVAGPRGPVPLQSRPPPRATSRPTPERSCCRRPIAAQAAATPREAGLIARREVDAKRLDSVLILSGRDDAVVMDLWSRNLAAPVLEGDLRQVVGDIMRERALARPASRPRP
jgi:ABC-2 type transport system permease protein